MKVDGPRTPRPAVGPKRTTGAKATGGAFSKLLRDGDAVAGPTTAAPLTLLIPSWQSRSVTPTKAAGPARRGRKPFWIAWKICVTACFLGSSRVID